MDVDGAQMLKGVLPLVSLAAVESADSYGYEVLAQLRAGGLGEVSDASVYGTLQRLYDAGLLSSYLVRSELGPPRKYYTLTTAGSAALKAGRDRWSQFQRAVSVLLDPAEAL